MYKRITRPASERGELYDVSLFQTNGNEFVSLVATDQTAPRRERVAISLTPDNAVELAASLILGAVNVRAGLHGNSGDALDLFDSDEAMNHIYIAAELDDWIRRRARERELSGIRDRALDRAADALDASAAAVTREG